MYLKCLIILVTFSIRPVWAKKYAVIVNGGDNGQSGANVGRNGEILRERFSQLAQQDAELYRSRGYEIIMVDANDGANAGDVARAISTITDATELNVSIYAHGTIRQGGVIPGQNSTHTGARVRFPVGYIRPDELENRDTSSIWRDSNIFTYFMAGENGNDNVGLGDLYDSIARAKLANPEMTTTLRTLSCYGGNAIRALESIPDLQVFSASDTTAPSFLLFDGPLGAPGTNLIDYNTFLIAAQQRGLNHLDAHLDAKRAYDDFALYRATSTTTSRPVNSIEMHFADLCLGAPQATEITPCRFPTTGIESGLSLNRSVGQIQLHNFLTSSFDEDIRFWNGVKASSCLENFEEIELSPILLSSFEQQMNRYFDETEARLSATDLSVFRRALSNWSSGCGLIVNCQFSDLRSRLEREGGYGAPFPVPEPNEAKRLLRASCPLLRSAGIPNSRQHQIECITSHGRDNPAEAIAMLGAVVEKTSDYMGECRRADSGIEFTNRLRNCLGNLNNLGDTNFWDKMLNLMHLGLQTP